MRISMCIFIIRKNHGIKFVCFYDLKYDTMVINLVIQIMWVTVKQDALAQNFLFYCIRCGVCTAVRLGMKLPVKINNIK